MRYEFDNIKTSVSSFNLGITEFDLKVINIKINESKKAILNKPALIKERDFGEPFKVIIDNTALVFKNKIKLFHRVIDNEEVFQFFPYENPPEIIGGLEALKQRMYYPEAARYHGIEDSLICYFLIDAKGIVRDFSIAIEPTHKNFGFQASVIQAILSSRWRPAEQRGKPVKVKMALPVRFELR